MIYLILAIMVIFVLPIINLYFLIELINKMHDEYLDCDDTFRDDDV